MAEDPVRSKQMADGLNGVLDLLEVLGDAPSEHIQATVISEKLIQCVQSKGIGLSNADLVILVENLIPKYASFQTRSLLATLHILFKELYTISAQTFLSVIIRSLDLAIARVAVKANAVSNYFTLLDWVNQVLLLSSQNNEDFVKYLPDLVRWQALLLCKCLAESKKKGLKASALRISRACLRGLFQQKESIVSGNTVDSYIKILVESKTSPFASAVALGMVAGVAQRLRDQLSKEVVESSKDLIYDFFVKEIIGSKTRVPVFVLTEFGWFFEAFTTQSDFETTLAPALERGILRSPELVLTDIIPPLCHSLKPEVDLSHTLSSKLLSQLISSLRSTNTAVREAALHATKEFISRCRDLTPLKTIAEVLVKTLKNERSVDARLGVCKVIEALPSNKPDLSNQIVQGLLPLFAKETNELVLSAMIDAFMLHQGVLLKDGSSMDDKLPNLMMSGLSEKRAKVKSAWVVAVSQLIWSVDEPSLATESVIALSKLLCKPLCLTFNEVVANSMQAAQNGTVISGYAISAATLGRWLEWNDDELAQLIKTEGIFNNIISVAPKPSFLLNDRIYTKLTNLRDQIWAINALEAVGRRAVTEMEIAWPLAAIYFVANPSLQKEVRFAAIKMFKRVLSLRDSEERCHAVDYIVLGLEDWVRQICEERKEGPAAAVGEKSLTRLKEIISTMLSSELASDTVYIRHVLSRIFVLCHHPRLSRQQWSWIELARHAHIDPGQLAESTTPKFIEAVREKMWPKEKDEDFQKASYAACGSLAFITPDTAIPLLLDLVESDLNSTVFNWITTTDLQIWKGVEGVMIIDVLAKPANGIPTRPGKPQKKGDWEAELRAEMEKKKGAAAKLSPKDQALVNEQLAKESAIRKKVAQACQIVKSGLGIVNSLIEIPSGLGVDLWYYRVLNILLRGVLQRCGGLVESKAAETYLNMSKLVSPRLGAFKVPIGVGLLRTLGIADTPKNWMEEPLDELKLRVLYRLRFLSEQHPLDLVSFQYSLPLVLEILNVQGQKTKDGSGDEEQITLALEFISFQAALTENVNLPRADIVRKLLSSLSHIPGVFKLAKDALLQITDAMSVNETKEESSVLVHGLLNPNANVRNVLLQALESFDLDETETPEILFLALHDSDERNTEIAKAIYETNGIQLDGYGLSRLFLSLEHETLYVRETAAKALASALTTLPELYDEYIQKLTNLYEERAKPVQPKYDKYGMIVKGETETLDPEQIRLSVALALEQLGPVLPSEKVEVILNFLIAREALGDASGAVREKMLFAGLVLIDSHGKQRLEEILHILNGYLDAAAKSSDIHDRIREAAVILLGAAARHLAPNDTRMDSIVDKLLVTLKTPSESVQTAVCDCLPPLIRARLHRVPELVKKLMTDLTTAPKYAERRGAAFGLAGVVAGAGIATLHASNILDGLSAAVTNKKDPKQREGALFGYEALLYSLNRLFEPFVHEVLPHLLVTYGDSATEVRTATSDTAKMIMRTISGHCVKEILPDLLAGLEESQWRSKKGSIEILGTMAYLAPKQLSISLPTVVPRLTGVLTDSHAQVRAAANSSLLKFGEVISNPEIQEMVPTLLKALGDPNKFTEPALDKLLTTAFIHYIDGPSLALILPILTRGLKERNPSSRRKSARILGSLGNLTDQRDLVTYLTELLPPLRDILSDAIPENRASAATSLGLLVEKLGEDSFPDLIDSLLDDLKIETGGIGRLGSAQALSEILSALGLHRLEDTLPEILSSTESPKSPVREAFINLLVYLPATFGNRFQPYLAQTVPKILAGLADDVDVVREAALRAGRIVVTNYAIKAVDILLPELEKAFFDDRWQIRHSSVELVGTMMYQLIGINRRPEDGEEEAPEEATETQRAALVEVLGQERRDRILSALYIARQDISGIVRIAAAQVFKTLVTNPQKTVREMLPTLTNMIVKNLASADEERRQGSARTLGDIVRKFGQGTLSELLPLLLKGLRSHDPVYVQGICIALVEVMNSASKESLEVFQDMLCDAVKQALHYPDAEVQKAAAEGFDALQAQFPSKAIDYIIPHLLRQLESENESESEVALGALREIMKGRSNARILGTLLPSLTTVPISAVNAKALGSLTEAAGSVINPRLGFILQNMMDSVILVDDSEWVDMLNESFQAIILSAEEDEGIRIVLTTLFSGLKHENPKRRAFALAQAGVFFKETDEDFSRYATQWASQLVSHFAERNDDVVTSAIRTLSAMTSKLEQDDLENCVVPVRQTVLSICVEDHELPGFVKPGGLAGVFAIYLSGLKRSSAEDAAHGIAELVLRTNLTSLKPITVQMIGALIRAIGERHPAAGKTAILHALATLLNVAPLFAKPFIPQLQRTAVKNLSDPASSDVRNGAALLLGALIPLQPRVDPLVTELTGVANSAGDDGVKAAILKALCEVVSKAGKLIGVVQRSALLSLISQVLEDGKGAIVAIGVRLMSLVLKLQSSESAMNYIRAQILDADASRNSIIALNAILFDPPACILDAEVIEEIVSLSLLASQSADDSISEAGILAIGKVLVNESFEKENRTIVTIFKVLIVLIRQPPSGSTDTQRLSLVVVRTVARKNYDLVHSYIRDLVGPVLLCARDSNVLPLKIAGEHAFMSLFQMGDNGTALLEKILPELEAPLRKGLQEYTKRIASKIAALESSVDGELTADELDDEREIASIGGMTF